MVAGSSRSRSHAQGSSTAPVGRSHRWGRVGATGAGGVMLFMPARGYGLCVDHCDDVFMQLEDGIAYVKEAGRPLNDPGSSGSLARVPIRLVQRVIHAAEDCPGECIFIEIDAPVDADLDVTVDARIAARIDIRD